jgi:hypothetical protein
MMPEVRGEETAGGLLVLGMHRSGTSLVAGSLHLLGLATCAPDDLMTGMPWNPGGHWESRSLSRFNDELLAEVGRSWWYPPPAEPRYYETMSRLLTTPQLAAVQFHRTYTSAPWVWKDPRLALLLPFWRQALGEVAAVVVVHRHPLDVSRSLELRNSLPVSVGMALWARYNRLLLEHCRGLSVLVVRYDGLLEDPGEWIRSAAAFLAAHGTVVRSDGAADARRFVEPALRHVGDSRTNVPADMVDRDLALEVDQLVSALAALEGVHPSFVPPALESERPVVEAELSARWPDRPPVWNDPPWSATPERPSAGAEGVARAPAAGDEDD